MKCDQCEMLSINGVACHETGCQNRNCAWDDDRQRWIKFRECHECGDRIELGEVCDCQDYDSYTDEMEQRDGDLHP